jgi:hypothetical protein
MTSPFTSVLPEFNNAVVDFDSVDSSAHDIVIDGNAFDTTREETIRSSAAFCQVKSPATGTIVEAVKSGGDISQQALALQLALAHPKRRNSQKLRNKSTFWSKVERTFWSKVERARKGHVVHSPISSDTLLANNTSHRLGVTSQRLRIRVKSYFILFHVIPTNVDTIRLLYLL